MKKIKSILRRLHCKHKESKLIHIGNHRIIFECASCGKQKIID